MDRKIISEMSYGVIFEHKEEGKKHRPAFADTNDTKNDKFLQYLATLKQKLCSTF